MIKMQRWSTSLEWKNNPSNANQVNLFFSPHKSDPFKPINLIRMNKENNWLHRWKIVWKQSHKFIIEGDLRIWITGWSVLASTVNYRSKCSGKSPVLIDVTKLKNHLPLPTKPVVSNWEVCWIEIQLMKCQLNLVWIIHFIQGNSNLGTKLFKVIYLQLIPLIRLEFDSIPAATVLIICSLRWIISSFVSKFKSFSTWRIEAMWNENEFQVNGFKLQLFKWLKKTNIISNVIIKTNFFSVVFNLDSSSFPRQKRIIINAIIKCRSSGISTHQFEEEIDVIRSQSNWISVTHLKKKTYKQKKKKRQDKWDVIDSTLIGCPFR